MNANLLLFIIIFLEGYAVLSTELLAIRLIIPFVGSATDTVSIIIAAVLMPLAFGYYAGGRFKPGLQKNGSFITLRNKLLLNLSFSAAVLSVGLSHAILKVFFESITNIFGVKDYLVETTLYSLIFIVLPIFLLGQTVPLISNYFREARLSHFAGKILFFSTLGSFMGAVFCTLILMPHIGVQNAASLTIACLLALTFLMARKKTSKYVFSAGIALVFSLLVNSPYIMSRLHIVSNNQYNTIEVKSSIAGDIRYMMINSTHASALYDREEDSRGAVFGYVRFLEENFINPFSERSSHPIDILVIGAGGFTAGLDDNKNNYTFVDIDPDLKDVAERDFLKQPLGPNKKFIANEARAFLAHNQHSFDLIFLDTYQDKSGVPMSLLTREYFQQIRRALKPGGAMVANIVSSPNFSTVYAKRVDNTIRSVFPHFNRAMVNPYDGFLRAPDYWRNVVYSAYNDPEPEDGIYTDDLNSAHLDRRKEAAQKTGTE